MRTEPKVTLMAGVTRWRRGAGEALVTVGAVATLFAAYGLWGAAPATEAHQRDLDVRLAQQWTPPDGAEPAAAAPPQQQLPPLTIGEPMARLYLPRLGRHWVVVEGVAGDDIVSAPGHYPDTARPGEIGNFAVAGHREPGIFWDLDRLQPGDPVIVQTGWGYFTYTVSGTDIVAPTAVEVVAPVPDHPDAVPTVAVLTLTTCNPKWDNYQRLVVHATLTATSDTAPPDLD